MKPSLLAAILVAAGLPTLFGQTTTEQRVQDFQSLASLYAKRYGPYEWKKRVFNFDLMNIGPWLERVRAARTDLEFYEICSEYVANLDDLHSAYRVPGNFVADLSFYVDFWGDRALVEGINRQRLPADRFGFAVGDELVSVDGRTVEQWVTEFSKFRRSGTEGNTRRGALDMITFRVQQLYPRAVEVGDTAQVVIRRAATGELATYTVPWTKTGRGVTQAGPVPTPRAAAPRESARLDPEKFLLEDWWMWKAPTDHPLLWGTTVNDDGEEVTRRYLLGWGSRTPLFANGFPQNFTLRLGRSPADFHFSGIYEFEGKRIGYIRFPNFSPPSLALAIAELDQEIAYFQANADGLVVDVMRNTGGGCYLVDAAARFHPSPFYSFGEEIRPTIDRMAAIRNQLQAARALQSPDWIVASLTAIAEQLEKAYAENRGMTAVLPACARSLTGSPATQVFIHQNATINYNKPLIVLVDEFSTSAGDIFASILQDNHRGPLVGTRTNGAGGSTSVWPVGFFSEGLTTNTNSLVVRRFWRSIPGYPTSPYIENVGVHADIPLDMMTRENLLQSGRPFVQDFSRILVRHIEESSR